MLNTAEIYIVDAKKVKSLLEKEVRKCLKADERSIRTLSELSGISTAHIVDIKNNHPTKRPSMGMLFDLADFYKIPYTFSISD